jgi:uncharacterized protein (TIGR04255 family)
MENVVSEVIFEIRWGDQNLITKGEIKSSPEYNILLGKFLEIFRKDYTTLETLPSAGMPEGLSRGIIQYRLRKSASENFPLVQLGPGIFSINIDKDNWTEFRSSIVTSVEKFAQISKEFGLDRIKIKLTYILAKDFDFEKEDLYGFLKKNLNIEISMGKDRKLEKLQTISFKSQIQYENPSGALQYLVAEGKRKERKAIIWQAHLESEIPQILNKRDLSEWLQSANIEVRKWVGI